MKETEEKKGAQDEDGKRSISSEAHQAMEEPTTSLCCAICYVHQHNTVSKNMYSFHSSLGTLTSSSHVNVDNSEKDQAKCKCSKHYAQLNACDAWLTLHAFCSAKTNLPLVFSHMKT